MKPIKTMRGNSRADVTAKGCEWLRAQPPRSKAYVVWSPRRKVTPANARRALFETWPWQVDCYPDPRRSRR